MVWLASESIASGIGEAPLPDVILVRNAVGCAKSRRDTRQRTQPAPRRFCARGRPSLAPLHTLRNVSFPELAQNRTQDVRIIVGPYLLVWIGGKLSPPRMLRQRSEILLVAGNRNNRGGELI